jgi:hypothetical protein
VLGTGTRSPESPDSILSSTTHILADDLLATVGLEVKKLPFKINSKPVDLPTTPAASEPPSVEPQTAVPEPPTVSGYRTMSSTHACCMLASKKQKIAIPEAASQFLVRSKQLVVWVSVVD